MNALRSFRTIVAALAEDGRARLIWLALLTVAGALMEFALLAAVVALLRRWLSAGAGSGDTNVILLLVGAALASGIIRYLLLVHTQRLAIDIGHRLTVAIQRRVLARSWTKHTAASSSEPLAAVDLTEQWLYFAFFPVLQAGSALVLATGVLAALLWFDPVAALAAAALLATLFLIATLLVRNKLTQAGEEFGSGVGQRIAAVQEHVGAMRELILANRRGDAAERFGRINRRLSDARLQMQVAQGMPRILVESVGIATLALVAWWLAGRPGGIAAALPTLAALGLGAQRLLPLMQTLSSSINALLTAGPVQQRVATMLAEPDLQQPPLPPALPFTRAITLDDVGFSYPGRDEGAVSGITLSLQRGERIALTGRNGSGKSTLADLIMGLLVPSFGRISVDGQPLEPELLGAWHRNISHVPQSPFVADVSLAENIAFMDERPDPAKVAEAARLVGLDDLIAALPEGLANRVGDRGQMLSGGQRQRLALARALYSQAPLLVLDEATSALDPESEAHVLQALDALQDRGTTILIIAHRETMLVGCDRVLRLEGGRLVAR